MSEVVIYTTRICPYCLRAKRLFDKKNIPFREVPVDGRPDLREQLVAESGSHTVPQIWLGDRHVGGCDDLYALEYRAELDDLLAEIGIANSAA